MSALASSNPFDYPRPPSSSSMRVMTDHSATSPAVPQQDTERTFDRLVDEGTQRLGRSWSGRLATGFLGGLDVGGGVLALLLLEETTHSALLGASNTPPTQTAFGSYLRSSWVSCWAPESSITRLSRR